LRRQDFARFAHRAGATPLAWLVVNSRLMVDVITSQECLSKALGFANDLFNAIETAGIG
jgi:hypothetical protein